MDKNPFRSKRPALKWQGSKWRIAPWIMSHFPHNHTMYLEPFGGTAAVLLQKPRSIMEVWNDLDGDVYNFFTVLRHYERELIRDIQMTPFHAEEYETAHQEVDETLFPDIEDQLIEKARRFYIRSHLSLMGPTVQYTNAFRRQRKYSRGKSGKSGMTAAAISFANTSHLHVISDRLRGVSFENMDAIQLIKLYANEDHLFYLDPPYPLSTRTQQKDQYVHEMSTDDQHTYFLNVVKGVPSIPLISSYESELYNDLLLPHGWEMRTKSARTNGPNARNEVLYLGPTLLERLKMEKK
jgi:DNA adenine methylase